MVNKIIQLKSRTRSARPLSVPYIKLSYGFRSPESYRPLGFCGSFESFLKFEAVLVIHCNGIEKGDQYIHKTHFIKRKSLKRH